MGATDVYLFLPDGVKECRWELPEGMRFSGAEGTLSVDALAALAKKDGEYPLTWHEAGGETEIRLHVLRSENTAAMWIATASGSMTYLHGGKKHEETVRITLRDVDGTVCYTTEGKDKMTGRGNSTWAADKKPYRLSLEEEVSLLDMGAGTEWLLLANAFDSTNLHNELAYTFSRGLEMEYTPATRYISLYLNGEYAGLYQLCERIELSDTRLNPRDGGDTVLYLQDPEGRKYSREYNMRSGPTVHLEGRGMLKDAEYTAACEFVQAAEDTLLSGGDWTAWYDVDSWVKHYLVDEVLENLDAGSHSLYFYSAGQNGQRKLYSGPVWDYDLILGQWLANPAPENLYAFKTVGIQYEPTLLYRAMYRSEVFQERLKALFAEKALPLLEDLANRWIGEMGEKYAAAMECNRVRWSMDAPDLDGMREYLIRRVAFFRSVWLEGEEYCMVEAVIKNRHASNWTVRKGETFETQGLALAGQGSEWFVYETGEPFDLSTPITEDVVLTWKEPAGNQMLTEGLVLAVSRIAVPGLAALALLMMLIHRKRSLGKK